MIMKYSKTSKFFFILLVLLFILQGIVFGEGAKETVEFPREKPIRLLNPYGAGGTTDIVGRILASTASEFVGQQLNVVSMPGAGGQEAINFILEQKHDGYNLLITDYGPLITTALSEQVNYELTDWVPILQINEGANIFFVRSDSQIQSVDDWISKARNNPDSITVAHGRYLAPPHLPLILLEELTDTSNIHVPTTGGAEVVSFVLGGQVDMGVSTVARTTSLIEAGEIRALGCSGEVRDSVLTEVPTFLELGYDVVLPFWFTIFAHKDVPRERMEFLEQNFIKALETESAKSLAGKLNVEMRLLGMEESAQVYERTIQNLKTILSAVME